MTMNSAKSYKDTAIRIQSIEHVESTSPFRFQVKYWRGVNPGQTPVNRTTQIFIPFETCWKFYLRSLEAYTRKQTELETDSTWLNWQLQDNLRVPALYRQKVKHYLIEHHDILRMIEGKPLNNLIDHVAGHTAQVLRAMGAQI